jgi:1L-myo-inositol 1-phosphate cytidylyltransferase / CDP-L-myo-inositol myo-inositolphosphotransferase
LIISYHHFLLTPIRKEASVQFKDSRNAIPSAPNLILLPFAAPLDSPNVEMRDREPNILGLGLVQRTVLAARRAGYGQIFFLTRDLAAPAGTTAVPNWRRLAEIVAASQTTSLVIASARILSETAWLERLAATELEPAAWATLSDRLVALAATAVVDALAALDAHGGAHDMAAVQDRLIRQFGSAEAIPVEIDPIVITTAKDIRVAEQRLLSALVKETDGFMARYVDRSISLRISRLLAPTAVTPNQITMLSTTIGVCGAAFFLSELWWWQTVGALLFLIHSIVDGCDGELARLKFQESRYGGILDFWGDNIVHIAIFACMAAGWTLASGLMWPLLLGAAATSAMLASAGMVYWRRMRTKDGHGPLFTSVSSTPNHRVAQLLDAASRRDFVYLVPVLALLNKSNWILVSASVVMPIFFILLVLLAVHERLQAGPTRSMAYWPVDRRTPPATFDC